MGVGRVERLSVCVFVIKNTALYRSVLQFLFFEVERCLQSRASPLSSAMAMVFE